MTDLTSMAATISSLQNPQLSPATAEYTVQTWASMANIWTLYVALTAPGDPLRTQYCEDLRLARIKLAHALREMDNEREMPLADWP